MTRERSHDFCHDQTRPLTTPKDEKLVEQENRKRKAAAKACQSLDTRVSRDRAASFRVGGLKKNA